MDRFLFFLYEPLATSFIRLWRDYTVLKKALSMERFDKQINTQDPQIFKKNRVRKTPHPIDSNG